MNKKSNQKNSKNNNKVLKWFNFYLKTSILLVNLHLLLFLRLNHHPPTTTRFNFQFSLKSSRNWKMCVPTICTKKSLNRLRSRRFICWWELIINISWRWLTILMAKAKAKANNNNIILNGLFVLFCLAGRPGSAYKIFSFIFFENNRLSAPRPV